MIGMKQSETEIGEIALKKTFDSGKISPDQWTFACLELPILQQVVVSVT